MTQLYHKFVVAHVPVPPADNLLKDPKLTEYKAFMISNMKDEIIFPYKWGLSIAQYKKYYEEIYITKLPVTSEALVEHTVNDITIIQWATKFPDDIMGIVANYIIRDDECDFCCDYSINAEFRRPEQRQAAKIFCHNFCYHEDFEGEEFQEKYAGRWYNMVDLAKEECVNQLYYDTLQHLPTWMTDTIDWTVAWGHIKNRYFIKDGHVFRLW
jgi:hypothetical protein